jgi:hypothetical protein
MRTAFCPAVTAVEDACLLGLRPEPRLVLDGCFAGPVSSPGTTLTSRPEYRQPPKMYSEMTKVTVTTLVHAGLIESGSIHEAALEFQAGELEYAVAALIIWMHTEAGKYVCADMHVWRVPLSSWPAHVKPFFDEARRLGQIFGRGDAEVRLAHQLRKGVSLAGRTDEQADWQQEISDRTQYTTAKLAFGEGVVSSAAYRAIRHKVLRRIIRRAMPALKRGGGSFGEYLQERWLRAPRGTTSAGGEVKRRLKLLGNDVLDLQMRPNKPVVFEVKSTAELLGEVARFPFCVARGSTKPEP